MMLFTAEQEAEIARLRAENERQRDLIEWMRSRVATIYQREMEQRIRIALPPR